MFSKFLNVNRLKIHLTKLKRTKRFAYIRSLGSQAVQDIAERIDRAYSVFWSNLKRGIRTTPPKFKAVRRYKSLTLKQAGCSLDEAKGRIKLGKSWYGYFQSRKTEGKVKTVTVKRDTLGDIYVYLVCDCQVEQAETRTGKSVGLDFGLHTFLTASDGNDIISPDFFTLNVKTIRTKCRKLSHKLKGSHNRERALNIKAMARLWGRKIHSLGFSEFVKVLDYEAMKFGTRIVFAPQFCP